MKITDISQAVRNPNRVNISVDGKYRFSLDIYQLSSLGLKIGREYSESELDNLETEGQFGKLYARALEYCLMRPHSKKEVRDYLWRKTRETKFKSRQTGEIKSRPGVSQELTERVFDRLTEKGYLDDEKFTRFWIEYRNQTKGSSLRKLTNELRVKGVESSIIDHVLSESTRNDSDEIVKIIKKKRSKYPDDQKLIAYLARQGFSYDEIKKALTSDD